MIRLMVAATVLLSVYLMALGCSKDQPTATGGATAAKVLVLGDNQTEDSLTRILDMAGFDVTSGGPYQDYAGTNSNAYDLVILLNGYDYGYEIADSVQQGLKSYVMGGGVLLTTEWMCYSIWTDSIYQILDSIIPLEYGGDDFSGQAETYLKVTDHAITSGVSDSFDTKVDWSFSLLIANSRTQTTANTVIYNGKTGGPSLVMGHLGAGRVIHWNMAGHWDGPDIWSPEVRRIFINIASFSKTI